MSAAEPQRSALCRQRRHPRPVDNDDTARQDGGELAFPAKTPDARTAPGAPECKCSQGKPARISLRVLLSAAEPQRSAPCRQRRHWLKCRRAAAKRALSAKTTPQRDSLVPVTSMKYGARILWTPQGFLTYTSTSGMLRWRRLGLPGTAKRPNGSKAHQIRQSNSRQRGGRQLMWGKRDWQQFFEISKRPWNRRRPPRPVYSVERNRITPAVGFSLWDQY
jgi:hypothetical protein